MNTVDPLLLLPKPPGGVGPWKRILVALKNTLVTGVQWAAYEFATEIGDAQSQEVDPLAVQWRHVVVRVSNGYTTDPADDQYLSFDVVNITNGDVDDSWTDSDYAAVSTPLQAFLTTMAGLMATPLVFTEIRWYARAFNAYTESKPFVKSGAPLGITVLNIPGTGSASLPWQCTSTVTEMTPTRRNWGRFYLPTLTPSSITAGGFLSQPAQDTIMGAAQLLYETWQNSEMFPVVPTTSVGGSKLDPDVPGSGPKPVRTLQVVTGLRTDDVIDVVRRRRPAHSNRVVSAP